MHIRLVANMGGIADTLPILADSGKSLGTNFFDDPKLVKTIAASIITAILLAAFAISLLPTLLLRMNIDPAFIGSSVPTTISNVARVLLFFGLAGRAHLWP